MEATVSEGKPLSERVLEDLHTRLYLLFVQIETLSRLIGGYCKAEHSLDNQETEGLGQMLDSISDKVHRCYLKASDWGHCEEAEQEEAESCCIR